jgi:hypothetical protein
MSNVKMSNVKMCLLGCNSTPTPKPRILTLAFLFPKRTDAFMNRLVAKVSKHKVCHVEMVFEDEMAFSIFSAGSLFFRQRTFSNPDYHVMSILVPASEYAAAYSFCQSAVQHEIGFSEFGMYACYMQPSLCPCLGTQSSLQEGYTFCSKIVCEALQFAGNCETEHLTPCTTTPSCLFEAFQNSQRKVLSSVPYRRTQLVEKGSAVEFRPCP